MVAAASAAPGRARTPICLVGIWGSRCLDGRSAIETGRIHGDKAIGGLPNGSYRTRRWDDSSTPNYGRTCAAKC
jgi:hypothetical protein